MDQWKERGQVTVTCEGEIVTQVYMVQLGMTDTKS